MTPGDVLREVEGLTHAARMARIVEVGRQETGDGSVARAISALAGGGFYERYLALQSCFGSRDGARVLAALDDPSHAIRGLAISLVPLVCDDAQAALALDRSPFAARRAIVRRLFTRGRQVPVDRFLDLLAARDDPHLTRLLAFGSPAVVERRLDAVLPSFGPDDWTRLARLHPVIAVDALRRPAEAADTLDQRLVWQANLALPTLARTAPDGALEIVRALLRHAPPSRLAAPLQELARRRPDAVAAILLPLEDRAPITFDRVAHRLTLDHLLALIARHGHTVRQTRLWFPRLAPEQREAVYRACADGWRDGSGAIAPTIVAELPRAPREAEGRRHLALPALAASPRARLPYAAFLPWSEAGSVLAASIGDPDPDLRVVALSAQIGAVRYARERAPEALTMVRSRRHEQDPVRGAMLMALADLPPGIWRPVHLDDLGAIVREALDAADLSHSTAAAAERLVVQALPFHPAWAAPWLATLVRERGRINLYSLSSRLTDDDTRRIAPALLPVLRSWQTREHEWQIIATASSLGRRLAAFDDLTAILEKLLQGTATPSIAGQALAVIAAHRRERLPRLIPSLLRRDESWVTQPVVYTYLHRHHQDLLTPYLGQRTYRGRFTSGKVRIILPFMSGFHRWTQGQQEIFAATLAGVTGDGGRDSPSIFTAIAQLAGLQGVAPTRLIALAGDERQAVRDVALRALGRLDAGQGVPTLLDALDDDRARIAIYALRRSLLAMPVGGALALLRAVPLKRVTVAKEVVRLLGDLSGSDEAYRELLGLDKQPLHRDVRVALLRALWARLEREESWTIVEEAARSTDPAVATVVGRIPTDRLSPRAQERLVGVIATLLAHPELRVRLDALQRCADLPVADPGQVLISRLLEAQGSPIPQERGAAARAVFATYGGRDVPLVGAAAALLLPNRRAITTMVEALRQSLTWSRGTLLPAARAVLDALAADPLAASLRVELAAHALPWNDLAVLLASMAGQGELHDDVLATAAAALRGAATRPDADGLSRLEEALAQHRDERLRRLALAALVAQAQAPRGWDEARLRRLQGYRRDPTPLVAAAAQFTFPPLEDLGV